MSMSNFNEKLQALLDEHPEVIEVRVKYQKNPVFKPRISRDAKPKDAPVVPVAIQGVDKMMTTVEEMLRNGDL